MTTRTALPRPRLEPLEDRTVPAVVAFTSEDFVDFVPNGSTFSSLEIQDDVEIQDLDVRVDLVSADVEELSAFLISPDGTRIQLFAEEAEGDEGLFTIFDDEARRLLAGTTSPANGRFRSSGLLSAFDGRSLQGTWRLEVAQNGDEPLGFINSWTLAATVATPTRTYESEDVPVFIDDFETVVSTVFVPDDFPVGDIDIRLDIEHTFDSDLTVVLVAPNGASVELFSGVGGDGQNFEGTILDDEASVDISDGSAPFTGRFRPSAFLPFLNGTPAGGTWRLEITDDFGGDTGFLNAWFLTLTPGYGEPLPDLQATLFTVEETEASWGDTLNVRYVVANVGEVPNDATELAIVASADATIDEADLVLARVPVGELFFFTQGGRLRVALPGAPLQPPPGFPVSGPIFIGLLIDPDRLLIESNALNNANRGTGIDTQPLLISTAPGSISGTAFEDLDGDAVRDPGEAALSRVRVFLDENGNGVYDPLERNTLTDEAGNYSFEGLRSQTFRVMAVTREGEVQTTPIAAPDRVFFRADFANGDEGFTTFGINRSWELSDERGRPSYHFGFPDTGLQTEEDATLLSPPIDLTDGAGARFNFDYFLDAEEGTDVVTVGVLVDGVETILARNDALTGGLANTLGFRRLSFDLSRFSGQTVQLFFRFTSEGGFDREGWFISAPEVTILGGERHLIDLGRGEDRANMNFAVHRPVDLIGTSFSVDRSTAVWGDQLTVTYSVANRGTLAAGPFEVELRLGSDRILGAADFLLTTLTLDGLAAGETRSGTVTVVLPGTANLPPVEFLGASRLFLGSIIDPAGEVAEFSDGNNRGRGVGRDLSAITVLAETPESEPNDAPTFADPIDIPSVHAGELSGANDRDFVRFTLSEAGRLVASVQAGNGSLDPSLTLLDATGRVLVTSRLASENDPAPFIELNLLAGDYFLAVSSAAPQSPTGRYRLLVDFAAGPNPVERFRPEVVQNSLTPTDLDGDGVVDFIGQSGTTILGGGVTVAIRGHGDGSFASPILVPGLQAERTVVADVNGDTFADLIGILGAFQTDITIGVALGNGDGTFRPAVPFDTVARLSDLVTGDFDGDGRIDLVGLDADGNLEVFLGNGDGSFRQPFVFEVETEIETTGSTPPTVLDLNRDGVPDLFFERGFFGTDDFTVQGAVLFGVGDGTFRQPVPLTEDELQEEVQFADVNGDGRLDVVSSDFLEFGVRLRLGGGGETFLNTELRTLGPQFRFSELAFGDVNGDGRVDLVATVVDSSVGVGVFLGNGDGTFGAMTRFGQGFGFGGLRVLDLDGDGALDVFGESVGNSAGGILFGNGDGTFRSLVEPNRLASLTELVAADLNGDGNLDLVGGNERDIDPSRVGARVVLGNGDGTFREPILLGVGSNLTELLVADLDRDGRLDLTGVESTRGELVVFLGNGDGSFRPEIRFGLEDRDGNSVPDFLFIGLVAADFTGDGILDLITAETSPLFGNLENRAVRLFAGRGDGTFSAPVRMFPGVNVAQMAAADLNEDGFIDLLGTVGSRGTSNGFAVLFGNGDGTFDEPISLNPELQFSDPIVVDLDGDGHLDLVLGPQGLQFGFSIPGVGIYYGRGDGTFETVVFPTSASPESRLSEPTVGDFNGDGILDLGGRTQVFIPSTPPFAPQTQDQVTVLLGNGDRTFGPPTTAPSPSALADPITGDFNGDGNLDLVSDGALTSLVIALGDGEGAFIPAPRRSAVPRRAVPIRADLDRDGIADLLVVNSGGDVLLRRGQAGANRFGPAEILNPNRPALEATVISTIDGLAVVSSNAGGGLTLYRFVGGSFVPSSIPPATDTAARIRSADLNGDSLDDLVTADRNKSVLTIYFQNADGTFSAPLAVPLGTGTNGVTFADIDGRDGLDILTVNRSSGDLSVFLNDPAHSFANAARYRASLSLVGMEAVLGTIHPVSSEEPIGLSVGDFTGDGIADVVVVERVARQLRVLAGDGNGGFANPTAAFSTPIGQEVGPGADLGQLLSSDFDFDGNLDVAIVAEGSDQLLIYRGTGSGTFLLLQTAPAGNSPTGMSVHQLNDDDGDGRIDANDFPDMLIGNSFGDVLALLGNGDGTFRSFVRTDQRVSFVATDLDGDGALDVVLAQQALDTAFSRLRTPGARAFSPGAFRLDGGDGLIGPGDVEIADLDGQNGGDLIFANTGSNNVLVYLRRADGTFDEAPLSFFAGTSPTDLHLNDLNGDGLMDLVVANQGSNDVSVLFGSRGADANQDGRVDGQDLFRLGPRLDSGGLGPNAVTTMDVNNDGVLDIVATNGLSGTVAMLAGTGNGSFDDSFNSTSPTLISSSGVEATRIVGGSGFALTTDNRIQAFNPITGVLGASFSPQGGAGISSFQTIQSGGQMLLFALNRDGTGTVLAATATGFAVVQSFQTPVSSPSELRVFDMGGNQFEIYLTDATLGSPTILGLDLSPQTPVTSPGSPGIIPPGPGLDPFEPPVVIGGVLDSVGDPTSGGVDSPFALVVTLVTSFGGDSSDRSGDEPINGLDPFTADGSVFGDLEDLVISEDGTVLSAGALALVSLESESEEEEEEEPEEEKVPQHESLPQFISGFKDELKQLIGEGVEVRPPAQDVPSVEPKAAPRPERPMTRSNESTPEAVEAIAAEVEQTDLGDQAVIERTEVVLTSEMEAERQPDWGMGTTTIAAALTLTGAYLGGYLPGVWYRPKGVSPRLRSRKSHVSPEPVEPYQ